MATDITREAQDGFDAGHIAAPARCPFYASSPAGMAWTAGAWMRAQGMPRPKTAKMSRGHSVRIDGIIIDTSELSG